MTLVQFCSAQVKATIKASVDKNKILLGEPIVLTIESYLSTDFVIKFIDIDSIPHFEFLEKPKLDSSTKDGGIVIKGVYKITSFDSGHWLIPSYTLTRGVKTDTIPIDVVFSDFDPQQDYHSIKDVIEVKTKKEGVPWWVYAIPGALLIIAALFFALSKKKPVPVVKEKVTTNPYEEAMLQLESLQRQNPDIKTYYAELVSIFRLYIFKKNGILSLQKTTDDLIMQVQNIITDKDEFDKLSQTLRLSDFVKFAKYIPSDSDKETSFQHIRNTITNIEKSEAKVLPEDRI